MAGLVAVLLLGVAAALADEWSYADVERVVAVADVHGAYQPMVRTLTNAGIVDADLAWSGGAAHLVIVGDILDRGPDSRDVMDLLMRLEGEAASAGGRVHVLIGNHEAMNLVGDLRYVARKEFAAFAEEETAAEREKWLTALAERSDVAAEGLDEFRADFNRRYPPGFFAHRRAFAAEGQYGKWLLSKPVIVVINGTAFVHGGLSPAVAEIGLDGVNGRLVDEMARYVAELEALYEGNVLLPTDNFYSHIDRLEAFMPKLDADVSLLDAVESAKILFGSEIHADDGPLWYRGNAACNRVIEEGRLIETLQAIGANRVVIGHTPTLTRQVLQRFDGRVVEIDTGMFRERYGGSGNALVIEGDSLSVVNEAGQVATVPRPHPRRAGMRPAGYVGPEVLERVLLQGEVTAVDVDDAGRTVATIEGEALTLKAVFQRRAGRGFFPELAAYRLDRLLELDMVPVTVLRDVDGKAGTLQFLPGELSNEALRSASQRGGSAMCPLADQWSAMYVFDALVYNEGRLPQYMLYSTDNWQLLLAGHDRAFAAKKGKPPYLKQVALAVTEGWRNVLEAITDDVIETELDDVLDKRRRKALAARRDELLATPP